MNNIIILRGGETRELGIRTKVRTFNYCIINIYKTDKKCFACQKIFNPNFCPFDVRTFVNTDPSAGARWRLIEGLLDERLEDNVLHCPQDVLHQVGVRGGRVETICHAALTSVMGQEFLFQKVSKIINASQQIVSHRTSEYLR